MARRKIVKVNLTVSNENKLNYVIVYRLRNLKGLLIVSLNVQKTLFISSTSFIKQKYNLQIRFYVEKERGMKNNGTG